MHLPLIRSYHHHFGTDNFKTHFVRLSVCITSGKWFQYNHNLYSVWMACGFFFFIPLRHIIFRPVSQFSSQQNIEKEPTHVCSIKEKEKLCSFHIFFIFIHTPNLDVHRSACLYIYLYTLYTYRPSCLVSWLEKSKTSLLFFFLCFFLVSRYFFVLLSDSQISFSFWKSARNKFLPLRRYRSASDLYSPSSTKCR
jgi:hypothetical protein